MIIIIIHIYIYIYIYIYIHNRWYQGKSKFFEKKVSISLHNPSIQVVIEKYSQKIEFVKKMMASLIMCINKGCT